MTNFEDVKSRRKFLIGLISSVLLTAVVFVGIFSGWIRRTVGSLLFGKKALPENAAKNQGNPYAYDIEKFRRIDPSLLHFSEAGHIPIEMSRPSGLAVGTDDRIYVAGDESVTVFNRDGFGRSTIPIGGPVYCLAPDKNGELFVAMNDHVAVFGQDGKRKADWDTPGEGALFTSIALAENFVFVGDAGNRVIWKFDKTGTLQQRIGGRNESNDFAGFVIPSAYFDVVVDSDGFLWAANTARHSLVNFTLDGAFRTSWGHYSWELDGFCGCCNPTNFLVLEDGSFVTSEKGIPRIKIYNQLGELVSVVAGPDQFVEGTAGLALAVDSEQRILVLDPMQKRVRIFTRNEA